MGDTHSVSASLRRGIGHSNWVPPALVLLAGCATVSSTESDFPPGNPSAARPAATASPGAVPVSTKVPTTPISHSNQGSPHVPDDPAGQWTRLGSPIHSTADTSSTTGVGFVLDPPARRISQTDPEADSLAAWDLGPSRQAPVWGEGTGKSYLIPAADIVGFQFLLNQFNRRFNAEDVYGTDFSSIEHNMHSGWVIDHDPFATNQALHPFQGSIYHGFARSAGLNYWVALGYDFAGSALWEVAGETVPPSLNDQITTSFAGSFLGEALFRMASYMLETGGERPGFFRRLGAALISPSTSFNRIAFGERFDGVFPSHDPATYTRVGIGWRRNEKQQDVAGTADLPQDELVGDFVMDYGLPGKPTYDYARPFDYFHFETAAVSSTNALPEDVIIRGLLCGSTYELGQSYRGIWGLYGGYDYISPEVFSVSSTSLSLGTTGQWWLSDSVALQGSCLGGVGWTAAGTIADAEIDRDYHYGISPEALVALRVIVSDVAVLDMTGRDFYLGSLGSSGRDDSETILRGKIALTVRVYGHHALGLQYVASSRDAQFPDSPDKHQSIGAVSLFYTYVSDTHFGAVQWR
jgi:hypothetical protein